MKTKLILSTEIKEAQIKYYKNYTDLKLINAMLGMEDTDGISVRNYSLKKR